MCARNGQDLLASFWIRPLGLTTHCTSRTSSLTPPKSRSTGTERRARARASGRDVTKGKRRPRSIASTSNAPSRPPRRTSCPFSNEESVRGFPCMTRYRRRRREHFF
ncbi:hypothetical protein BC826DRAFT_522512 [Russula brevipes]|nr:hypothetical protein BC826DRAFT_522512 [Russula brevipes]